MAAIKLIVGLGNPGREYEHTRHNAGFWFADELAWQWKAAFKEEKKFFGEVARVARPEGDVWLLKPNTFMNRSGQAVAALAQFYKIKPEEIMVAHDELDIACGRIKFKLGGGNGGTEELARENMRMAAEITGQIPKLAQLLDWRDRVMVQIGSTLAKAGEVQMPRILHLRAANTHLTATGRNSYQHGFIELVGAQNVAAELGVESSVTSEQILAWQPDIILLSSADPEALPQRVYDDPILSHLSAAQHQRIYKTPQGGYIWDSASPENPFTWMWLANLAHPELFAFDLRQELRQGFRLLYDFELSDADIDRILRLDVNAGARGYQVFSSP